MSWSWTSTRWVRMGWADGSCELASDINNHPSFNAAGEDGIAADIDLAHSRIGIKWASPLLSVISFPVTPRNKPSKLTATRFPFAGLPDSFQKTLTETIFTLLMNCQLTMRIHFLSSRMPNFLVAGGWARLSICNFRPS